MINYLFVFIGGGMGAMTRYGISRLYPSTGNDFPLGTFIANICSCIILGLLLAYTHKNGMNQKTQLLLITGFCGGFSTFSTFSSETFNLLQSGNVTTAFLYVMLSILVCVSVIFAFYFWGQKCL